MYVEEWDPVTQKWLKHPKEEANMTNDRDDLDLERFGREMHEAQRRAGQQKEPLDERTNLKAADAEAVRRDRAITIANMLGEQARREAEAKAPPGPDHDKLYAAYVRQLGIQPGSHRRGIGL